MSLGFRVWDLGFRNLIDTNESSWHTIHTQMSLAHATRKEHATHMNKHATRMNEHAIHVNEHAIHVNEAATGHE
jgi:hypothetical protein